MKKNLIQEIERLGVLLEKSLITQEEFEALKNELLTKDIVVRKKNIDDPNSYLSELILYFIIIRIWLDLTPELFEKVKNELHKRDYFNSVNKHVFEEMIGRGLLESVPEYYKDQTNEIFIKNILSSIDLILKDLDQNQVKGKKEIAETLLLHQQIIEKFFDDNKVPTRKILNESFDKFIKFERKIHLYWKGFDKNEDIFLACNDEIINVWSNKEKVDSTEFCKIYNYFVDKYGLNKSYYFPFDE